MDGGYIAGGMKGDEPRWGGGGSVILVSADEGMVVGREGPLNGEYDDLGRGLGWKADEEVPLLVLRRFASGAALAPDAERGGVGAEECQFRYWWGIVIWLIVMNCRKAITDLEADFSKPDRNDLMNVAVDSMTEILSLMLGCDSETSERDDIPESLLSFLPPLLPLVVKLLKPIIALIAASGSS